MEYGWNVFPGEGELKRRIVLRILKKTLWRLLDRLFGQKPKRK